jgi:hypothetical protein
MCKTNQIQYMHLIPWTRHRGSEQLVSRTNRLLNGTFFFFLYMFLVNQRFIFHDYLLCRPSQRSAHSQVPSQVATHQEIGSQLWAGETLDSNPGLQDNSLVRYH